MTSKIETISTYRDFVSYFPENKPDRAVRFLLSERFKDGLCCVGCGSQSIVPISTRVDYRCRDCKRQFSPMSGTIFHGSKISPVKWAYALKLLLSNNGYTAMDLMKELDISYTSAWTMLQKLRRILPAPTKIQEHIDDIVELDEAYLGGKSNRWSKNKMAKVKPYLGNLQGRDTQTKIPIFAAKSRKGLRVAFEIESVKGDYLKKRIAPYLTVGGIIITDEFPIYKSFDDTYRREVVQHGQREYVNKEPKYIKGENVHNNGVESEFNQIKNMIFGTHRGVSKKHMDSYLNEYTFRKNNKNLQTESLLKLSLSNIGQRITYGDLTRFHYKAHNYSGRGPDYPLALAAMTKKRGAYPRAKLEMFAERGIKDREDKLKHKDTFEKEFSTHIDISNIKSATYTVQQDLSLGEIPNPKIVQLKYVHELTGKMLLGNSGSIERKLNRPNDKFVKSMIKGLLEDSDDIERRALMQYFQDKSMEKTMQYFLHRIIKKEEMEFEKKVDSVRKRRRVYDFKMWEPPDEFD